LHPGSKGFLPLPAVLDVATYVEPPPPHCSPDELGRVSVPQVCFFLLSVLVIAFVCVRLRPSRVVINRVLLVCFLGDPFRPMRNLQLLSPCGWVKCSRLWLEVFVVTFQFPSLPDAPLPFVTFVCSAGLPYGCPSLTGLLPSLSFM